MPDAKSLKPWSLLAYTVADDKGSGHALDASAKEEIKAVCDVVDFSQISVAVQVDFKFTPGVFRASLTSMEGREFGDIDADDQPMWREIKQKLERSELSVQKSDKELNAASGEVLADFLKYGARTCPAERHLFVMYGHANGPMGLFYDRDSSRKVPHTMRLNNLAEAMQGAGGRVAVALFRDCFMSNLEAAYQLRGATEFMIASQSLVPIAGIWPWHEMLPRVSGEAPTERVATGLANALGAFLDGTRGEFSDAPLSLLDLRAADQFVEPLKELSSALVAARNEPGRCRECARAMDAARIGFPNVPSNPGDPALVDVIRMCDNLVRLGSDPVVSPARRLANVLRNQVVKWLHCQEHNYQGVSLYCKPSTKEMTDRSYIESGDEEEAEADKAAYRKLALCEATGWDQIALNPLIAL